VIFDKQEPGSAIVGQIYVCVPPTVNRIASSHVPFKSLSIQSYTIGNTDSAITFKNEHN